MLATSHWKEIQTRSFELAVLPWGATEAHNYHLPYATDNFETEAIAIKSVELANTNGAKAIVLPTIPYGVNTGQTDIPLCINMNPSTQHMILQDILQSVYNSGIRKFLILNGHGGNDFKQIIRELGGQFPDILLFSCNWFQALDKKVYFENDGDHADEMETSLMLYLFPETVLPLDESGDGKSRSFSIPGLNESWAWTERKWSSVTDDTGIGNPKKASREKGESYFNALTEKISALIHGISATDPDKMYQ